MIIPEVGQSLVLPSRRRPLKSTKKGRGPLQVRIMNPQPTLENKIIAIVDDHETLMKAMASLIKSFGAQALSYETTLDFLQDMPKVDCLLIDYYMPDLNSLQLAVELRKRGYDAPIIILTGMIDEIP